VRAVWLEGAIGIPDVVVAEAKGCGYYLGC
jgi:hypothetical protein